MKRNYVQHQGSALHSGTELNRQKIFFCSRKVFTFGIFRVKVKQPEGVKGFVIYFCFSSLISLLVLIPPCVQIPHGPSPSWMQCCNLNVASFLSVTISKKRLRSSSFSLVCLVKPLQIPHRQEHHKSCWPGPCRRPSGAQHAHMQELQTWRSDLLRREKSTLSKLKMTPFCAHSWKCHTQPEFSQLCVHPGFPAQPGSLHQLTALQSSL